MFDFIVQPDDGEQFSVTAGPRDILAWENAHKGVSLRALMSEYKMTQLYQLAYQAATRQKLYKGTFAEFQETCDVTAPIKDDDADDSEDPTQPGR